MVHYHIKILLYSTLLLITSVVYAGLTKGNAPLPRPPEDDDVTTSTTPEPKHEDDDVTEGTTPEPKLEDLCILHIQEGKIELALKEYYDLSDCCLLNEIIKNSYNGSLENFYNVLKFSRYLHYLKESANAYTTLYDEMKINNQLDTSEMLTFAKRINEHIEMDNYNDLKPRYKKMFQILHSKLPTSLTSLISDGSQNCTILSERFKEFMYAGSWFHKDAYGRKVYTWTPGSIEDGAFYWNITFINETLGFTIQNQFYDNEYLTSEGEGTIRTLSTLNTYWKIEPHGPNNGTVKIKSDGLYLGAYHYTGWVYRRAVAVKNEIYWDGQLNESNAGRGDIWKLKCDW